MVDLDDYKTSLVGSLSDAWEMARTAVKKAQSRQKKYYDVRARESRLQVGDRVFVYMPSAKKGKAHKFARPFHGPFRVIELTSNDAKVIPVDKPHDPPIYVALERVRLCPDELPEGEFWPSRRRGTAKTSGNTTTVQEQADRDPPADDLPTPVQPGIWEGRLRKKTSPREDARS